jgi:hypothetical protein
MLVITPYYPATPGERLVCFTLPTGPYASKFGQCNTVVGNTGYGVINETIMIFYGNYPPTSVLVFEAFTNRKYGLLLSLEN